MQTVFQDIRYALRQLRRTPGFACTALVILALGIGGTTAIFSALNRILFEPLLYPHGDVKQMSLAISESDAAYTTTTQWHRGDGTLSLALRYE